MLELLLAFDEIGLEGFYEDPILGILVHPPLLDIAWQGLANATAYKLWKNEKPAY